MGRLVSCPDCGHKVSKSAVNCPNCGRPFRAQAGERFSVSGCGLISAGLFVAVVGSFLFLSLILRFGGAFPVASSEPYNSLATISARWSIRLLSLTSCMQL